MAEKTLNPIFESMDVEEEVKYQLQETFEKAVLAEATKMIEEHLEEKLTEEKERLEEAYNEKVEMLTESMDAYLDTVVEEFISENASTYEAEINEETVKTLLGMFDKMLSVAGVDMIALKEGIDRVNEETEDRIKELEEKVADMADKLVEARKEGEKYLKTGIINEMKEGLTILEAEKFEKLADMVPFEKSDAYLEKLETIKESIIDSRDEDFQMEENVKLPGDIFKEKQVKPEEVLDFSKYI